MRRLFVLLTLSFHFTLSLLNGQNHEIYNLFLKYYEFNISGDFINAYKTLNLIINPKNKLSSEYSLAAYNNLGVICLTLGNYDKALEFNQKAEKYIDKSLNSSDLADIFNNRGRIYNIKKSYDIAATYLEKSIRIYSIIDNEESSILNNLAAAYINISVALIEKRKYSEALAYLRKNVEIGLKYKLSSLSLTYLNIAKTYTKLGNFQETEAYYSKCINCFSNTNKNDYYRLAEVYFDYGLFLKSEGKIEEALMTHKKALAICLKNYGERHTLTSLSYKHIADDYLSLNTLDSSLIYYQKSLIAVSKEFSNSDIYTNPAIDSSLFDLRLLDNLKAKAKALDMLSQTENDQSDKIRTRTFSLETIKLAIQLIERIRNSYLSEESRIYLAENEKETYMLAAGIAYGLYISTGNISWGVEMYGIAQKAKAAVLRNDITGNELLYSGGVPDSLREKQNTLDGNIAAYSNLVLEENRKIKPDSAKISLWKDALFDMNREKEKISSAIDRIFPQYHDLIFKTEPLSLQNIQKKLKKNVTLIDYLLSNQYTGGKRRLYVFLITGNRLVVSEQWLDSLFYKSAEIIRNTADPSVASDRSKTYAQYTDALNYMFFNLIRPLENRLGGKRLIIVPDEEIGWLPFEAFLKDKPTQEQNDYEGLHYLIRDYTFSYAYSSSLIFAGTGHSPKRSLVFAFSPDYKGVAQSDSNPSYLKGTGEEISSVYHWFGGMAFSGKNATKSNFINCLDKPGIFHLAMHSMTDSADTRFSYLLFDSQRASDEESRLYNYEISLKRMTSSMVVLSSCNSGGGTLFYGEGVMSLARSFTLAGASSVIKTAWEINDESSAAIIKRFYFHLFRGMYKDEAMRLAKLEYLEKSAPSAANPYYWAAYEVLGDSAPVQKGTRYIIIIFSLIVVLSAGGTFFYFRRRRIFSETLP